MHVGVSEHRYQHLTMSWDFTNLFKRKVQR